MYDAVPGGQQVYVEKTGRVGYTQAHSSFVPEGAYTTGFRFTPGQERPGAVTFGSFAFTGGEATGFVACPEDGAWRVYANTVDSNLGAECLGFGALTLVYGGPVAWQYA